MRAIERQILSDSLEEQRLGTAEDASAIKARETALKLLMPVRIGGPKEAIAFARAASKTWEEGGGEYHPAELPPPRPTGTQDLQRPAAQPVAASHGLVQVSCVSHDVHKGVCGFLSDDDMHKL